jgi:hypothetical protein
MLHKFNCANILFIYLFKITAVNVKVPHVDQSLREVASLSLAKLTPFDPKFMIDSVLPKLIPSAAHPSDVCLRHGALLAVAEIVGALGALNKVRTPTNLHCHSKFMVLTILLRVLIMIIG